LPNQIRRRFAKSFLDILILRLVNAEATWGYDIIKKTESEYNVKLRHGALYPMLNELENRGMIKSRKELQKGRARKVYQITEAGRQLLSAYYEFARQQIAQRASEQQLG
jgi:PadR family transcriptional regulator PadR